MPRKPREMAVSGIYHVVIRGIDRQLMFEEKEDYEIYLQFLNMYKIDCNLKIYAYCLMSNHVHLIVHVGDVPLGQVFSKINTNYAIWFNQKYQRTGPLQQGRYYSEPIDSEDYFLTAVRYVHNNPRKAGLEMTVGESYRWSSYHEYMSDSAEIVDTSMLFQYIPAEQFRSYANVESDAECMDIENIRRRIPDPEAWKLIKELSGCANSNEFQSLTINQRNRYFFLLNKKRLSLKQLSRLTGISVGVITRAVAKEANRRDVDDASSPVPCEALSSPIPIYRDTP